MNTRATYNATANNCDAHSAHCNRSVTPWLSLGCGYRRTIDKHAGDGASAGQQHWDFGYDYEVVHSWMLGRELNNPYYAKFPQQRKR